MSLRHKDKFHIRWDFENACYKVNIAEYDGGDVYDAGYVEGMLEALEAAHDLFHAFGEARDPMMQAHYLVELSNAMSDLASWHPKYDIKTGRINPAGGPLEDWDGMPNR